VSVVNCTLALHTQGRVWTHCGSVITDWVNALVDAGIPFGNWLALFAACGRGVTVDQFCAEAALQVAAGYMGEISKLPRTFPEQVLSGKLITLLAVWSTHMEVLFVVQAHMRLSLVATTIGLLR
jgi:hypothetical protein